jgi:serine/threonine-protein kinase
VPDLSGADEAAAGKRLKDVGLVANVVKAASETVPSGKVVDWQPRTGTLPKGGSVLVTVSSGPPSIPVPDAKGKSFADAQALLKEAGFNAVRADVFSDSTPVNVVDSTSPPAGSSAQKGSTVTINVSKGPDQVVVPDVRGLRIEEATAALQGVGLQVGSIYGPKHGRRVIDTAPQAGAKARRGTSVDLYVFG